MSAFLLAQQMAQERAQRVALMREASPFTAAIVDEWRALGVDVRASYCEAENGVVYGRPGPIGVSPSPPGYLGKKKPPAIAGRGRK